MRSIRIVATLGPACSSPGVLDRMIEAGMNVARMNFSHGSHDDHRARIADLRERADRAGKPVAILQDLQGPKIRTGRLAGGGPVDLVAGEPFVLTTREVEGDAACVQVSYENLPRDVRPGNRILISDGLIEVRVEACEDTEVRTRVINGGRLKERQGINLPGAKLSLPGLTEKDVADLEFGLSQHVEYVAISFVRTAADVRLVRDIINANNSDAQVIAKLEKPEAVENLDAILDEADGAMVARGDLGVEVSPEKVPLLQKRIIAECNRRSKPVITATQMLESMITNPRPTRAEASDVANAVLDGTDALMLSGETAVGAWPVLAVETMARIAGEIQDSDPRRWETVMSPWTAGEVTCSPEAIAAAVASIVKTLDEVDAIWVYTQTATTARLISHYRPHVPIMGFTPDKRVWRRMALYWGVTPILTGPARSASDFDRQIVPLIMEKGLCSPGDTVLITGSHPFERTAPTNFLKIQRIE